ncbi:MAG: cytochrome c [Paracoccaceae bacterium]|jgi:mono/diheme cytochrome c family protein|nr:cytochrome c [Paracoccaceae bacterium]
MRRLFLMAAALAAAGSAAADPVGRAEYLVACAGCHGESAMGDGPLAGLLEIETPGLTRLAAATGGEFPYESVIATIDGRDGVRAHGDPMPVWGDRYVTAALVAEGEAASPETVDMMARARILSLVVYLISIQE